MQRKAEGLLSSMQEGLSLISRTGRKKKSSVRRQFASRTSLGQMGSLQNVRMESRGGHYQEVDMGSDIFLLCKAATHSLIQGGIPSCQQVSGYIVQRGAGMHSVFR